MAGGFLFVCWCVFGVFLFVFCTVGIGKSTVGASGGKNLSNLSNTERRLCLCTSLLTWVRFPHSCEHAQGDQEQIYVVSLYKIELLYIP